jgi:hypothetical protein
MMPARAKLSRMLTNKRYNEFIYSLGCLAGEKHLIQTSKPYIHKMADDTG